MENYLQYVHNIKEVRASDKSVQGTNNAVLHNYIQKLEDFNSLQKNILQDSNTEVLQFISTHLDLQTYCKSIIYTRNNSSYIEDVDFNNIRAIVNFKKINHTRLPNNLFRAVNTLLPDGGIYVGKVETYAERRENIYRKYGRYLGHVIRLSDFIINRFIPRIPYIEKLYYYLTNARFHAMSKAELLGRLVYCGFETVDIKSINGLSYFVALKTGEFQHHQNPTMYPIIRLSRIGKEGKEIGVYKLRTMHPYSEYLQDYVIKLYGYNKKGKPAHDFRVALWGKLFRKFWLDEIFQIFNLLKGEMRLVGLRPLSSFKFESLPEDLKRERIKYKPGCIPPYVALNMPDEKQNIEAEWIYIREYKKHPVRTNIKYFFKALYNIATIKISSC